MQINLWYKGNSEALLFGRYITLSKLSDLLEFYKNFFKISEVGFSELGKPIPCIELGHGKTKVLVWSQMHGNESTTTKALFDLLKFLIQKKYFQKEIETFLNSYSLFILPILNPDGAEKYTRSNANNVDLNRDAQNLSQSESRVLRNLFNTLKPHLCLNMHDQRSIYGFKDGNSAIISFLAPAADIDKSITPGRKLAMEHIVRMNNHLQKIIPNQVGRYSDVYNENCVGDAFQQAGVPTILFEAGQDGKDYNRENTREYIFYSLLVLFKILEDSKDFNYKNYFEIPENIENFYDYILRNVRINNLETAVSIGIRYSEYLKSNEIIFEPILIEVGNLNNFFGHFEVNGEGAEILLNSQKSSNIGEKVLTIVNKSEKNIIYFQ